MFYEYDIRFNVIENLKKIDFGTVNGPKMHDNDSPSCMVPGSTSHNRCLMQIKENQCGMASAYMYYTSHNHDRDVYSTCYYITPSPTV